MNMYLLCALFIHSDASQHQETAVSHISVYRESVSDSHSQFSCCTVDPLFTVGGFIHGQYRTINLPTRCLYQVPPINHLRVPAGHLKLVFVACSTTYHGGGEVHLGRGCVGRGYMCIPYINVYMNTGDVLLKCIYGCETWVLKEREKSRLQATEMRVLRKITGVSRLDHVRNETVRERLGLEPVLKKVERRRECWKEKVESRKRSVVEKVLMGEGVGKRPRGRSRKRWRDPF